MPYEANGILMANSTRGYTLAGPPGVRVDIGLDFEENEHRKDNMLLTVRAGEGKRRRGEAVPGSQIRRIVCGVTLTQKGVAVDIRNHNPVRSAHYSLRIARSPSQMCRLRRAVPSTALVDAGWRNPLVESSR